MNYRLIRSDFLLISLRDVFAPCSIRNAPAHAGCPAGEQSHSDEMRQDRSCSDLANGVPPRKSENMIFRPERSGVHDIGPTLYDSARGNGDNRFRCHTRPSADTCSLSTPAATVARTRKSPGSCK